MYLYLYSNANQTQVGHRQALCVRLFAVAMTVSRDVRFVRSKSVATRRGSYIKIAVEGNEKIVARFVEMCVCAHIKQLKKNISATIQMML